MTRTPSTPLFSLMMACFSPSRRAMDGPPVLNVQPLTWILPPLASMSGRPEGGCFQLPR